MCHLIFIHCKMVAVVVSYGLCFKFDEGGALGRAQAFGESLYNSENLGDEIYNVHNFTAPQPQPKPNIIPTSKLIHCPYGILWRLWSGNNVEDCYL